jgi:hypothetical protein
MKERVEFLMQTLFGSHISIMDIFVAMIIGHLGGWYLFLFIPWFAYSNHQKIKYDGV